MTSIKTLLRSKSSEIFCIEPEATVYRALERMAERDIGALLVTEQSRVVGIFTERDYARNIVLKGKSSRDTPVKELMVTPVLFVRPEQTVNDCMALMTDKRVRHLPVMDDDTLVGIVSIGDLVGQIIREQDHTIDQLESYITGGH